jgi:asparagine synthase (glutamine-hydrolysing)
LSLVVRSRDRAGFDRLGLAEQLLYGFPLEGRTLFNEIERVAPAAAIQIRRKAKEIVVSSLMVPHISPDPGITTDSIRETARDLAAAFTRACSVRVSQTERTTLGLSGGLDSRSVAAALTENRQPFLAITRCGNLLEAQEARIAAEVASVLHLDWKVVRIARPTGADLLTLLKLRSGMNSLGVAHMVPFLHSLQTDLGHGIVYLTGEGGGKILPDRRPRTKVRDEQSLIRCILATYSTFPLWMVAKITGVAEVDVLSALVSRLRSYPEEDPEEKYVHFFLFERGFKFGYEGEDRNRNFFWSTSPFYGREFLDRALRCPGRTKANFLLYRYFMESLNPKLVDVKNTTSGPSLRVDGHPIRRLVRELGKRKPAGLRKKWRMMTMKPGRDLLECVRLQLASTSPATEYLCPRSTIAILGRLDRTQAYMLLTLTSTIEYFESGTSTLDRYYDSYL